MGVSWWIIEHIPMPLINYSVGGMNELVILPTVCLDVFVVRLTRTKGTGGNQ